MDIHKLMSIFTVLIGLTLAYKFNGGLVMTPAVLSGTAFVLIGMNALLPRK